MSRLTLPNVSALRVSADSVFRLIFLIGVA
jgi:hypothetical protein